jgi:bacterioferritin
MGAKSRAATWISRLGARKSHQARRLSHIPVHGLAGGVFDHWLQLAGPCNLWPVSRTQADSVKNEEKAMATATVPTEKKLTREKLVALLNEDLAREYQAIIAYVNYSQVLKGAAYMNIAAELEVHAKEELQHAIILANQIDYMGGMPVVVPKPVKTSEKAEEMLRFDLDNENETIRNYRQRIRQCDQLGEYATAEHIRTILLQEQDHQISLATALGIDVPNLSEPSASSQE